MASPEQQLVANFPAGAPIIDVPAVNRTGLALLVLLLAAGAFLVLRRR